jgi:EamA domain-containing membrane protein RarD
LVFARLAPRLLPEQSDADEILMTFVAAPGVTAIASLATVTPLVFITLGARHSTTVTLGVAGWLAAAVTVLLAIAFAMNTFSSAAIISCLLLAASFAAVTCAGLLLTRRGGYRLLRRGRG